MSSIRELSVEEGRELVESMCQKKRNMSLDEWVEKVKSGEIQPYSHDNLYHSEDAQIAMSLPFADIDFNSIVP